MSASEKPCKPLRGTSSEAKEMETPIEFQRLLSLQEEPYRWKSSGLQLHKRKPGAVSLSANALPGLGPTSADLGAASSRPSRQGHLFALARTKSHSPQTYFFLVCFLLSFSSDLLSNIWPEVTLLINTAIFSFTRAMEGPHFFTLPPLQFPFSMGFLVPDLCCKSLPFCSPVSKALKQ